MITRIVKLTFLPDEVDTFVSIFNNSKVSIRNFPGCQYLELNREKDAGNIFFTYSIWESQEALESYRKSILFQETWAQTKILFAAKAEAWSTFTHTKLP